MASRAAKIENRRLLAKRKSGHNTDHGSKHNTHRQGGVITTGGAVLPNMPSVLTNQKS